MSQIFISYARSTEAEAQLITESLRELGYSVWRDDQLPAHRPYAEVIEERLRAAQAVVVLWSAEGVKSQWVRAEADVARQAGSLVQLRLDATPLPLPFAQVHCADLAGWRGDPAAPGWRKVVAGVARLLDRAPRTPAQSGRVLVDIPPIDDPSPPPGAGDFAQQLHRGIEAALSSQPTLSVAPAGADGASTDAGRAEYRVEVQIRRSGPRLRIWARLAWTHDHAQLWNERYDAGLADADGLAGRVAERIAAGVEANIRRHRIVHAAQDDIAGLDANALFLRAAMAVNRLQKAGYLEALPLLEAVLAADPQHAHALAMAALAHFNIWVNGYAEAADANRDEGLAFARRALDVPGADAFSTGLAAVALAHLGEPVAESRALIDDLRGRNPGFPPVWLWSGQICLIAGDLETALDHLAAAGRLDPAMTVRAVLLATIGAALMLHGRLDDAAATLVEAAQLAPEMPMANLFLASCYGHLGHLGDARAVLSRAAAVAPAKAYRLPLRHPGQRAHFAVGLAAAQNMP